MTNNQPNRFLREIFLVFFVSLFILSCSNEDITPSPSPEPVLYDPGIVLTFDDVFVDEWYTAHQTLAAYNWKATFFITKYAEYTDEQKQKLHSLKDDGHEIAGHGLNHVKATDYVLSYGMTNYVNNEILPMITLMNNDGFNVKTFAYPYGNRNTALDNQLINYFEILRGTTYGRVNPAQQNCFFTGSRVIYGLGLDQNYGNDIDYLKSLMIYAKEHHKIVVFYAHKIVNQVTDSYQTPIDKLEQICRFANDNGLKFYKTNELSNL